MKIHRPRLLILGHAQHGKDTAAEYLRDKHGYQFVSSSWFMAERVVFPAMMYCNKKNFGIHQFPYANAKEAFEDRANHRGFWYEQIAAYNANDPARLTKAIFAEGNDMYVGLRNARELHAGRLQKAFDLAIWIDASLRCASEHKSSCTVEPWMADVIVDNNGTLEDLAINIQHLYNNWIKDEEWEGLDDDF